MNQSSQPQEAKKELIAVEGIASKILFLRGEKVLLDHDLAELYGVKTYRLNEQVKRNLKRFPDDFMFRLSENEKAEVIAKCDHLKNLKYSPVLPYAFTEHGTVMAATILNTDVAINVSVQVVRTFVKLRKYALDYSDLTRKIVAMEKKYDSQFKIVFDAIRQMMAPPPVKTRKIGFQIEREKEFQ